MSDVRCICAIGRCGQLGLNGRLPWEGRLERAYVEDVERFSTPTRGHVVIAGPTTINSVPDWAAPIPQWPSARASRQKRCSPAPGRVVFVGAAPAVWEAYAPSSRHWDITRLPYDGDADRWFSPAWVVAGRR